MTSCQGTIRIDLEPGDNVRIKSGSVENAIGTVEEINAEEHLSLIHISSEFQTAPAIIGRIVSLIDEGNTIPLSLIHI